MTPRRTSDSRPVVDRRALDLHLVDLHLLVFLCAVGAALAQGCHRRTGDVRGPGPSTLPPAPTADAGVPSDGSAPPPPPADAAPPPPPPPPPPPADAGPPPPPVDAGPPPECRVAGDCDDGVDCTADACEAGRCASRALDSRCPGGGRCDALRGCIPTTPACAESPCQLRAPQCGCPSGQGCYVSGSSRACLPSGIAGEGGGCTDQNDCAPGHVCTGVGVCQRVCTIDAHCPGVGNLCVVDLTGASPRVLLCTGNCDPILQTGCPRGSMCSLAQDRASRWATVCEAAGTRRQGDTCSLTSECAAGHVCAGACAKWCRPGVAGDCPSGTACGGLEDDIYVGPMRYNVCW